MCGEWVGSSNTPLQALVLLNDTAFVEASRHLAARIMIEGGKDFTKRINYAFKLVHSRNAKTKEIQICEDLYKKQYASFKADPERAAALLEVGESANPEGLDSLEQASWTTIASMLLNLHETITRE